MYDYAIRIKQGNDGSMKVSCRDLPEINFTASDRHDAVTKSFGAIETALSRFVEQRKAIPESTPSLEDEVMVRLSAVNIAKIALWNEMIKRGMRKADLCRELGIAQTQGDRLVDFRHPSKIDQIEAALKQLNTGIRVSPHDPAWIELPFGGAQAGFYVGRLVDEFSRRGITEMLTGATKSNLEGVNPESLDYLLRTRYARHPNTMQAVKAVYDQLEASGLFEYLPKGPGVRTAGVLRLK